MPSGPSGLDRRVIGAHALHRASSLLTFDQRIYRAAFPTLNVVVPTM
jgi:predicted nucleic acid-binding protein